MTVPAGDGRALEALAHYCLRNPVSLARLRWVTGSATATYQPRVGHDDEKADAIDALDFVARLLAHVPDPRRHLVHYYGAYSNVVRGKLKARRARAAAGRSPSHHPWRGRHPGQARRGRVMARDRFATCASSLHTVR